MTTVQYAHRAQRRYFHLLSLKNDPQAKAWGKVVDALFAGEGDEAARRATEGGFSEEAVEILRIFSKSS